MNSDTDGRPETTASPPAPSEGSAPGSGKGVRRGRSPDAVRALPRTGLYIGGMTLPEILDVCEREAEDYLRLKESGAEAMPDLTRGVVIGVMRKQGRWVSMREISQIVLGRWDRVTVRKVTPKVLWAIRHGVAERRATFGSERWVYRIKEDL